MKFAALSSLPPDSRRLQVKIQQEGLWAVGLGPRKKEALNALPATGAPDGFWLLRENGGLFHVRICLIVAAEIKIYVTLTAF